MGADPLQTAVGLLFFRLNGTPWQGGRFTRAASNSSCRTRAFLDGGPSRQSGGEGSPEGHVPDIIASTQDSIDVVARTAKR